MEKEKTTPESFYSIGEVSLMTETKPYVLRYWEKEFPFLQPMKNKAGHRVYSKKDIFIIENIKELLHEKGYSIAGAKKVLWKILIGEKDISLEDIIKEIQGDLRELITIIDKNLGS
ncbi:MAG: MerR family transcriptional regulator [Spirochaetota bacterium]|nr:MAG: MerR family transcriptional regulator [Spirochaetota bacterium]